MLKVATFTAFFTAAALWLAPRPAEACAPARILPKPPPPVRYAVPPPAPPVVVKTPLCPRVPVQVQCQSATIPCTRIVYRYVCQRRLQVVPPCAPPRYCKPYRRYYRPGVPRYYRRYYRAYPRPRRIYRNLSPYHPKSTPYLGIGGGYFSMIKPGGGYEHLKAMGDASAFFGWNFGGIFALELGLSNTFMKPDKEALGNVSRVGLIGMTLDTRFRLVKPAPSNWAVPYLQAGLGVYVLAGGFPESCGSCKTRKMAHGGGVQLGGGVDFYLNRYVILGTRVLYRYLLMSELRGDGTVFRTAKPTRVHGVSAGLTFTMFWSHL